MTTSFLYSMSRESDGFIQVTLKTGWYCIVCLSHWKGSINLFSCVSFIFLTFIFWIYLICFFIHFLYFAHLLKVKVYAPLPFLSCLITLHICFQSSGPPLSFVFSMYLYRYLECLHPFLTFLLKINIHSQAKSFLLVISSIHPISLANIPSAVLWSSALCFLFQ